MATEEHKKLSAFIKETHSRLRQECQQYGPKEAWNRHVSRTGDLQNYAEYMKELATSHWTQNRDPLQKNITTHCRIQWIRQQCYNYYFEGGKCKYDSREILISAKMADAKSPKESPTSPISPISPISPKLPSPALQDLKPLEILDVGSCYNPLGDDENFHVTPIDLAPSSPEVFKCDFLNVPIGPSPNLQPSYQITQLPPNTYDVCVFSLLLEYLPCPDQRFHCCKKAHELLKPGGLLIIVTPDSKHVGANAKIMKSWRFVLAHLGFMRITYEKLKHLHCISFRKCGDRDVARRWAEIQAVQEDDILFKSLHKVFIPQDFQEIKPQEEKTEDRLGEEDKSLGFCELPEFID